MNPEDYYQTQIENTAAKYLEKHHSPYGINDFQNALSTSVLKAFDYASNYMLNNLWIPITEGLPEKDGRYLCVIQEEDMMWTNICEFTNGKFDDFVITHWMPIPNLNQQPDTMAPEDYYKKLSEYASEPFKKGQNFMLNNLWIPVDKLLPTNGSTVLCRFNDGEVIFAYYNPTLKNWYWENPTYKSITPSHWMPIPQYTPPNP